MKQSARSHLALCVLCQVTNDLCRASTTGTPGRIRTCYPRLRRPMLYPNELRALRIPLSRLILADCCVARVLGSSRMALYAAVLGSGILLRPTSCIPALVRARPPCTHLKYAVREAPLSPIATPLARDQSLRPSALASCFSLTHATALPPPKIGPWKGILGSYCVQLS